MTTVYPDNQENTPPSDYEGNNTEYSPYSPQSDFEGNASEDLEGSSSSLAFDVIPPSQERGDRAPLGTLFPLNGSAVEDTPDNPQPGPSGNPPRVSLLDQARRRLRRVIHKLTGGNSEEDAISISSEEDVASVHSNDSDSSASESLLR